MGYLLNFFFFGLGAIIGSFLNAVIYRLYRSQTLLGYSACPNCRSRLFAFDLVPVFSFFWLKGKCRFCGNKISFQYVLVEVITGFAFAQAYHLNGIFTETFSLKSAALLFFELFIISVLVLIFVYDYKYYLIPDVFILLGILAALPYLYLSSKLTVYNSLLGIGIVAGFFGILYLVSGGKWIGFGDVKLGVFLGLLLGPVLSLLMLLLAYTSGALVGVLLVIAKKKSMKGILPFGTFLSSATLVTFFWGPGILEWYLGNFYF